MNFTCFFLPFLGWLLENMTMWLMLSYYGAELLEGCGPTPSGVP